MAYEVISLQGYTFEVDHSELTIPEGVPQVPGMPPPGTTIAVHKLQLLDAVYDPVGNLVGLRRVYEIEMEDRQRDELVRQLQGGAPPRPGGGPQLVTAGPEALRHLPPLHDQKGS